MTLRNTLSVSAILLSMLVACAQTGDAGQSQQIKVSDPDGAARSVVVLETRRAGTSAYAEVRMGQRDFTLAQWTDADTGARHNVVSSSDGALRYESITDASDARVVLTDASGTRVASAGEPLGGLDSDAATLLSNFRPGAGDEVAYYETYCVGYDTSNPADWHLVVGACTCEHWYSVICTMH
jgi:hypothetical protein